MKKIIFLPADVINNFHENYIFCVPRGSVFEGYFFLVIHFNNTGESEIFGFFYFKQFHILFLVITLIFQDEKKETLWLCILF